MSLLRISLSLCLCATFALAQEKQSTPRLEGIVVDATCQVPGQAPAFDPSGQTYLRPGFTPVALCQHTPQAPFLNPAR